MNEWHRTWLSRSRVATLVSFASDERMAGAFAQHQLVLVDLQSVAVGPDDAHYYSDYYSYN